MFPISVSGSIRLRDLGNPAPFVKPTLERIVDLLDEKGAVGISPDIDTVGFKTNLFSFAGRSSVLGMVDSGTFSIETEDTSLRVRYRLSTVRMLLVIFALVVLVFGGAVYGDIQRGENWHFAAAMVVGGWLWIFGVNYVVAMIRVPLWLKRGL